MKRRRTAPAVAALSAALVLSGCSGSDTARTSSSVSTTSRTVTTTSLNLAPSTDGFQATLTEHAGADQSISWNYQLPQVEGGEKKVRDAFNAAMSAATDRLVPGPADLETTFTDATLMPEESSRTVVGRTTLSGALIVDVMFTGAAHPSTQVQTVVVEAGAGRTLTLDDIFADPAAAREQLVSLARAADPTGRLADSSIAPAELTQWIALDEGLHLYVPVIHALDDFAPVTIAWPDVAPLLNPTGRILFAAA